MWNLLNSTYITVLIPVICWNICRQQPTNNAFLTYDVCSICWNTGVPPAYCSNSLDTPVRSLLINYGAVRHKVLSLMRVCVCITTWKSIVFWPVCSFSLSDSSQLLLISSNSWSISVVPLIFIKTCSKCKLVKLTFFGWTHFTNMLLYQHTSYSL